jgi:hypothetical protein
MCASAREEEGKGVAEFGRAVREWTKGEMRGLHRGVGRCRQLRVLRCDYGCTAEGGRRLWILGAVFDVEVHLSVHHRPHRLTLSFPSSFCIENLTRDGHSRWGRAAARGVLGSHERARGLGLRRDPASGGSMTPPSGRSSEPSAVCSILPYSSGSPSCLSSAAPAGVHL